VQTILQFGDQSQKDLILARLCEKASEVSKTPYGHFTILKAITYCTHAADQRRIAASLKNHFVSLGMRMMMIMMMILMVMIVLLFLLLVVIVVMVMENVVMMMIDCTEGTHVIGSRVVESILQLYPAPLSRALKAEFYGQVSSCDP